MWGFLQDAEVSLDSINRGLMLPLSRESWVLKEAPCIISSPVKNDDWERSAVAAHFIASREQCQGSSRPQSRQSSRPRSRPSSTQGCRKPKRTAASLSELKESASNRAATWLKSYAAYEQSELLQVALTLGDVRRNSLQRMSSAPETLRPSSATNRGHDRRGKVSGAAATNLQRSQYGRHMRKQCLGLRCKAGEERPLHKEERSGWPAPWADAVPPSPGDVHGIRPSTTPSRTREKKTEAKGATTGVVRAVECDKRFQAQLLESWRRTTNAEEASERVHRRQVCQFFDFLRKPDGDMDMDSGVLPYIEEGFASSEFVEGEMARAAPDLHAKDMPSAGGELSASKKTAIRQVLVLYSQVARPQNPGAQEVLFRASFCRFILDSNLVTMEAEDTERPTYHKSVRLFDNISKFGSGGLARFANIDHCVTLVIQLMMQINMPAALAWELFEEGLQKAERTAEALLRETQNKVKLCSEALAKDITEEAILERRMDMFGKHGSPPQLFQGPLAVWTRGLRFWINNITESCMPENISDRIDQILAHNRYVRDEIIEPGCLYILAKFQGLFELFNAYCYEEKTAIKEDENGKIRNESVPHMSFAGFFRFCLDFSVFPELVSFEEAWQAYSSADCVSLLGTKERPVKVKQFKKAEANPSRVSAILGLRSIVNRNRKGKERESIDYDKKTETSASEQEEEEEEQTETESSEEEEEEEEPEPHIMRPRGTTGAGPAGSDLSGDSSRVSSRLGSRQESGDGSLPLHSRPPSQKNTLLLPVSPQRPRRGVNNEEVAAALRNHRRQSVGPADAEVQVHAQIAIQQSATKVEVDEAPQDPAPPESAAAPKAARTSASGPTGPSPRQSPWTSPRNPATNKETKEAEDEAKVPRRSSGEPSVKTAGNRFLSVLGALDPSKVKDLDLGSARDLGPKKAIPRVKVTADFSWLQKPFREMTDKELKGYSLLISLDDCCRDHFLDVRGLVQVGKIQRSRQGFLSYIAFMELLKKFRITHGFETSSQLQEFMQVIDPCSGGQLDPVELEKAINAVREDEARRRPDAAARGGPWAQTLGEKARQLSTSPMEVDAAGKEVPVAFTMAAFFETLLLLGHHHMQGSGALIKCCAASAAKATYLVNFLHHQHDRLVKLHKAQRQNATTAAAEQAATVLVRPRSPPPSPPVEANQSVRQSGTSSSALNKMVGAARKVLRDTNTKEERLHHRNAVVTAVADLEPTPTPLRAETPNHGLSRQASKNADEGPPPSSRGQKDDSHRAAQQEHWPDTASYTTVAEVLIKNNQDIFKRWMDGEGKLPQLSPWFSDSNKICSKCKRQRDSQGIGNVFCHVCSCVDAKPLNETLLYPAMERARLRRKMGSETFGVPPTQNHHRPSSQLSGSGSN